MTNTTATLSALSERLVGAEQRAYADVRDDLLEGLQGALELELATLPLYMIATWSIIDPTAKAWALTREVFKDEMWHLANICNLIAGLGGSPLLRDRAPTFPGPLPRGVHSRLRFGIDRLSRAGVRSFMELEHPAKDVVSGLASPEAETVGRLYERVIAVLSAHQPALDATRQIDQAGGQGSAEPIATVEAAIAALEAIVGEGEGTSSSPDDQVEGDRAHYYRFAELYYGRRLEWNQATRTGSYTGEPVPMPRAYAVAEAPDGGWTQADTSAEAWEALLHFDDVWTNLLTDLQATWAGAQPDQDAFDRALGNMSKLKPAARKIMALGYVPRFQVA